MPSLYVHLGLEERRRIFRLREAKVPAARIATARGRRRSTIHREIARNCWGDAEVPQAEGHRPPTAQDLSVHRRRANTKLERHAELRAAVVDRLCAGRSPGRIAGRRRVEPATPHRLCHETIHRFVRSPRGRSEKLARHLPERRRRWRPRLARKPRSAVFPDHAAIRHGPLTIEQRAEFGYWEAALMILRKEPGLANFATLVERHSHTVVLFQDNDRQSRPIGSRLIDALAPLPAEAPRSVTFDRGSEFAAWRAPEPGLGARAWFCDPQGPWQKGTVQNTNRRVRRRPPRETDVLTVRDHAIGSLRDRLNATLRKCLAWRTPAEAFHDHPMEPPSPT